MMSTNSGMRVEGAASAARATRSIGLRTPAESMNIVPAPPKARHLSAPRREGSVMGFVLPGMGILLARRRAGGFYSRLEPDGFARNRCKGLSQARLFTFWSRIQH